MFFEEKSRQVSVSGMDALAFQSALDMHLLTNCQKCSCSPKRWLVFGLHDHVKSVYDSKACFCVIELNDSTNWYDDEGRNIKVCAEKTIAQFQWDGSVFFRNDTANLLENLRGRLELLDKYADGIY